MTLYSKELNIDLLYDIFRTHPMWNYNYYLIIESKEDDKIEPIGIGFKSVEIFNKDLNKLVNISDENIQDILSDGQYSTELFCEDGITHDGSIHKFIEEIYSGSAHKRNVLVMEIKKNEGEYKDRIEKSSNAITSVIHAWVLENAYPSEWKTTGFDAMSNEVFIQATIFTAENVKVIKMSEEIARAKARIAISKLF